MNNQLISNQSIDIKMKKTQKKNPRHSNKNVQYRSHNLSLRNLFNNTWISRIRQHGRRLGVTVGSAVVALTFSTFFPGFLSGNVLVQYAGPAQDATQFLPFRIKNNLPFDIVVDEFAYAPHAVIMQADRDVYHNEVKPAYDDFGRVIGLTSKDDPGIDIKTQKDRLTGVLVLSGDENTFQLPVTLPNIGKERKMTFSLTYRTRPENGLLNIFSAIGNVFRSDKGERTLFFVMENGQVQSISQSQFHKPIEKI